jgi:hypothetical protein
MQSTTSGIDFSFRFQRMTAPIATVTRSTTAARMRLRRERRRAGLRCLMIELRETEIDVLIGKGLLNSEMRRHPLATLERCRYDCRSRVEQLSSRASMDPLCGTRGQPVSEVLREKASSQRGQCSEESPLDISESRLGHKSSQY